MNSENDPMLIPQEAVNLLGPLWENIPLLRHSLESTLINRSRKNMAGDTTNTSHLYSINLCLTSAFLWLMRRGTVRVSVS